MASTTAYFIKKKVTGVYTHSLETIYLFPVHTGSWWGNLFHDISGILRCLYIILFHYNFDDLGFSIRKSVLFSSLLSYTGCPETIFFSWCMYIFFIMPSLSFLGIKILGQWGRLYAYYKTDGWFLTCIQKYIGHFSFGIVVVFIYFCQGVIPDIFVHTYDRPSRPPT